MEKAVRVGFVCFGEVNTPYERLEKKHEEAAALLSQWGIDYLDGGIVIDDSGYETADRAIGRLEGQRISGLIVCVAGWIPSHAVIRVTDVFRHLPLLLWGMCGWMEENRLVTTADQAGTTALRAVFEAMEYSFSYVYSTMDGGAPREGIENYYRAVTTLKKLRQARVGTMGYRDMLLYGTLFEGTSLRASLGVEVEPFEMLEVVKNLEKIKDSEVEKWTAYVKENWKIKGENTEPVIRKGVGYALAIGKKVEERGYEAVTLLDVDGMKRLLGFPPAMIFMLLNRMYDVEVIPENDILGSVTQLIAKYATKETAPYMEYYEFFKDHLLAGVPDFIPETVVSGEVTMQPSAFGLLDSSLLNISKVRTGRVTCMRLMYRSGSYAMHAYTGEAKEPPLWEECGWEPPAPQLPSLSIYPDSCTVEEFAQKVASQHTILSYGDQMGVIKEICRLGKIHML